MTLDSLGASPVPLLGPHQREAGGSESEMEEVALLIVKTEEGTVSLGRSPSRRWKRPEMILPGASGRIRPAQAWV